VAEKIKVLEGVSIINRGGIWQFQMWLASENKMVRESLKTTNVRVATQLAQKRWAEITTNADKGKPHFSMKASQAVEAYIEYKTKALGRGIKAGRLGTIRTHLNHWLAFIGDGTKLKDLHLDSCADYYQFRNQIREKAQTTLVNEKATINAMWEFLYKRGEVRFGEFEFPQLNKYELDTEKVRRQTLTNEEYNRLVRTMRVYVQPKDHHLEERERYIRQMMRYYVLIASNCGLRTGELQQLRWLEVSLTMEQPDYADKKTLYANIVVLDHTSKTNRTRRLKCRGGYFFQQWQAFSGLGKDNPTDLVFSLDGKTRISNRLILYHWHRLMKLAEIKDYEERKIVPYSLRHFMITQRILAGLSYEQVAKMCGTGRDQIERVYSHVTEESLRTAAYADYKRNRDGSVTQLSAKTPPKPKTPRKPA
jgi:integrase